ncbi:MAG TPA: tRNA guanosine(34) transglycosylase Tgt [Streptosporangiaceae bacterium]|nr:tRNA guanosine(34) transglycosylase Tgt [Streptosporangiaceae bacterium]
MSHSVLPTRRGDISLPQFVPDATRAVVRGLPTGALPRTGVETILVSTAHLISQPGTSVVQALGGVHGFMGWSGPVISDSGGFQAFSLLTGQKGLATVSDAGLSYRFSPKQRFRDLTPRSCIETQLRLGADVVYCLDYCTHPLAPDAEQEKSVALTVRWAAECRAVFDRLVADTPPEQRPKLFAVVQGGQRADLRARCADALVDLGFDGYGFGGYPVAAGQLVAEVELTAQLLPPGSVLHGLGIGTPESLVAAWRSGYSIFDCTLPTRNARRGVLYTSMDTGNLDGDGRVSRIARMSDEKWVRAAGPVDPDCDCELCTGYSAGYLAHLFRVEDSLAHTLASAHNLRFYTRLTAALRGHPASTLPRAVR